MRSQQWVLAVAMIAGLAAAWLPVSVARAAEVADLQEQLEDVLKARRPQEFKFIATVVGMVQKETLPRSLVDTTFLWARKKKANRLQYFETALRVRAAKQGIKIP